MQILDRDSLYPTPNDPGNDSLDGVVSVRYPIGSDPLISGNIIGAITNLFYEKNFVQVGDMTESETAEFYERVEFMTKTFCEAIIECINDDEDTKNALSNFFTAGGGGVAPNGAETTVGKSSAAYSDDNLLDSISCDLDSIAGACIAVVEELNVIAENWIEAMTGASLPSEIVGYLIQTVPILEVIIPVDFGDMADWVTDEVLTQYTASYNNSLRNQIADDLYVLCCQDCTMTLDDIIQAFANNIGFGFTPDSDWQDVLRELLEFDLGSQIVSAMFALITTTWKAQSLFNGTSGIQLLAYAVSKSTPISPSIVGFTECGTWESVIDYTVDEYGTITFVTWGSYVEDEGWQSQNVPSLGAKQVRLQVEFGSAFVTNVEVTINLDVLGDVSGTVLDYLLSSRIGTTPKSEVSGKWTASGVYTYSVTPDENIDNVVVFARPNDKDAAGAGLAFIEKLELTGTGIKPSVLP